MIVKYFRQEPNSIFKIKTRINVLYSTTDGVPTIQIYPFEIESGEETYGFAGLNAGNWSPQTGSAVLAVITENNKLNLVVIQPDMINEEISKIDNSVKVLGIIMYIGKELITVLDHGEE